MLFASTLNSPSTPHFTGSCSFQSVDLCIYNLQSPCGIHPPNLSRSLIPRTLPSAPNQMFVSRTSSQTTKPPSAVHDPPPNPPKQWTRPTIPAQAPPPQHNAGSASATCWRNHDETLNLPRFLALHTSQSPQCSLSTSNTLTLSLSLLRKPDGSTTER